MEEAKREYASKYHMNKYQQALVRGSLKFLLCCPIFDPKEFDLGRPWPEIRLIGVLNFDSDQDLRPVFGDRDKNEALLRTALSWSHRLAKLLKPA